MTNSEIFNFSCLCLLPKVSPELEKVIKKKIQSGEVEFEPFIYLNSNNYVLPAITLRLQQYDFLKFFPKEYATHLLEVLELNRKRNRQILRQVEDINQMLELENIQALYLKGTANLLDKLYSDVGERMIGDIDFLVQEKDYLKCAELFLSNGYENQFRTYSDFRSMKHYPRLFKKDVPADVEIHRMPVNLPFSSQFNTDLLFQHKKESKEVPNRYVSCDRHKLIHTFIHSQLSNKGYLYRTSGLRDLYDTYLLLQRVNAEETLQQTEAIKKARQYFSYVDWLFNNKPIQKGKDKLAKKHQWFFNHPGAHRFYVKTIKWYELLIVTYLWRILRAPFDKNSFQHIYRRVKDPKWYKMHFKYLKKRI